jgi:2-phosphoglycerate kinase
MRKAGARLSLKIIITSLHIVPVENKIQTESEYQTFLLLMIAVFDKHVQKTRLHTN